MKKKLTIYCLIAISTAILAGCKGADTTDGGANILKKQDIGKKMEIQPLNGEIDGKKLEDPYGVPKK